MSATAEVVIAGRTVVVRELSVNDLRNWLVELSGGRQVDIAQTFVFDDCCLEDMADMCDMSAADMAEHGPVTLAPLHEKCKLLNPHFFRARAELTSFARALKNELSSSSSTEASPSSPDEDIQTS